MLTPQQIQTTIKIQQITNPVIRERWMRFFQLPEDLQEAIFSEKTNKQILEITKQKHLINFQTSILFSLIGSFLSGEIPPNKLTRTIQEECLLEEIETQELVSQLAKKIFSPLKDSLQKIYGLTPEIKTEEPKLSPTQNYQPPARPNSYSEPSSFVKATHDKRKIFVPKLDGNIVNLKDLE